MSQTISALLAKRQQDLTNYCTNRNKLDEIYLMARSILSQFHMCKNTEKLQQYLLNGCTILLRDICRELGYEYFSCLLTSNAIDTLDTVSLLSRTKQI